MRDPEMRLSDFHILSYGPGYAQKIMKGIFIIPAGLTHLDTGLRMAKSSISFKFAHDIVDL